MKTPKLPRINLDSDYCRTNAELAACLGCAVTSIPRWRRLPDAPKRHPEGDHLEEWATWLAKREKAQGRTDRDRLQCAKLEIEIRTLTVKHDRLAASLTPTIDLTVFRDRLRADLKAAFKDAARGLARKIAGKTAAEIRPLLRKREDDIFAGIADTTKD